MYIPDNWGGIVPKVVHYKTKNIYNYVFHKPNNMIMYIYVYDILCCLRNTTPFSNHHVFNQRLFNSDCLPLPNDPGLLRRFLRVHHIEGNLSHRITRFLHYTYHASRQAMSCWFVDTKDGWNIIFVFVVCFDRKPLVYEHIWISTFLISGPDDVKLIVWIMKRSLE